jgi:hypothetical protein
VFLRFTCVCLYVCALSVCVRAFCVCVSVCVCTAGPSAEVKAIAAMVGGTPSINPQEYTVDCSTIPNMPSVTVTLNGKQFVLSATDYVLNVEGVECILGFVGELGGGGGGGVYTLRRWRSRARGCSCRSHQ